MRRQTNRKENRRTYFIYAVLFIIAAFLVYMPFILKKRSFVFCDEFGGGDGLVQHYNAFVYYGKYLREIARTLIRHHKLVIPMFDLSIGYGQDIITTLSYYVIGDPFSFLSAFIPTKFSEYGYSLLIILRQFAAGIAFIAFLNYINSVGNLNSHAIKDTSIAQFRTPRIYIVIGALLYSFSSYPVVMGLIHPYFLNPMIYLPILLMGAEKMLRGGRSKQFIIAVAISALSNFYFFYMLVIVIVLYVLIRFFVKKYIQNDDQNNSAQKNIVQNNNEQNNNVANSKMSFGRTFLRFLLSGLLGGGIAAVLLIPSLLGILTSSRVGGSSYVPILYDGDYYTDILGFFLTGSGFKNYPIMGYTAVGLLSLVLFIISVIRQIRKKKIDDSGESNKLSEENLSLLIFLIMMIIFIIFPFFGHAFNGFSYVTNRWIWAFSLLIAYITARNLPLIENLAITKSIEGKNLSLSAIVVFLVATAVCTFIPLINPDFRIATNSADTNRVAPNVVGVFIALGAAIILSIAIIITARSRSKGFIGLRAVTIILLIISLAQNSYLRFMPAGDNMQACYVESGEAYGRLVYDAPAGVLKQIRDPEKAKAFYRFDTPHFNNYNSGRNSSMQYEKYSTAYYFSTSNPNVREFFSELYINFPTEQSFVNLDSRSALMSLLGVRYSIVFTAYPEYVPYSYDHEEYFGVTYGLYESDMYLPLGFTSDKYIARETFDELNPVEKQEALLQGILIEGGSGSAGTAKETNGISNYIAGLTEQTLGTIKVSNSIINGTIVNSEGVTYAKSDVYSNQNAIINGSANTCIAGSSFSGSFYVTEENGYVDIEFEETMPAILSGDDIDESDYSEIYVVFEGLDYKPDTEYTDAHNEAVIRMVGSDGKSSWVTIYNEQDNYYNGRHNFLSNMHYTEEGRSGIRFYFRDKGEYSVDGLTLIYQPTKDFPGMISEMQEETIDNSSDKLTINLGLKGGADKNKVSGEIEVSKKKLLCFSIPYSEGWTAYVDGEKQDILKADIAFMAVELQPGKHDVELRYTTPYLKLSGVISVLSILIFIALCIRERIQKR